MRKLALVLATALMLSSCTSSTKFGKCVGINDQEDPALRYEYSAWNIILAAVFVETIFVPVLVVLDDLKCPVEKKDK